MKMRVVGVDVFLRRVRTRMEFKYGKASVTGLPYAHLRVRFEGGGTGVTAQGLPPLWFDKSPGATHEDGIRELLRSIAIAAEVWGALPPLTAHGLHQAGEPEARRRAAAERMNGLTAGFGVALMDAATVDAVCRGTGATFHAALRDGLLGLRVPRLPSKPLDRIQVRHTVGLADPLVAGDVKERIADGFPETLEEVIRAYQVRGFKVKIGGDPDGALDRLRRVAAVLDRGRPDSFVTLDGNEQFESMEAVEAFVRRIEGEPALRDFWKRTCWIEQPVERSRALDETVREPLRAVGKPVILDESDDADDVAIQGLRLGYAGISAKLCKGVFRTLHSYGLGGILSSEDLMNIPIVPLQQDLCVAAALGIPHSERNGHHYVRGFEFLSPREREAALSEYASLYQPSPPSLRLVDGELDLRDVNAFGFGVRGEPDWDPLERIA